MFPRRRRDEWRGGAAKYSGFSGGGDHGRLRNRGHDCVARKGAGVSRLRLRESAFGRDGPHQRYQDKAIIIAGDDVHRIENNPGREKALAADEAVAGVAICPQLQRRTACEGIDGFQRLGSPKSGSCITPVGRCSSRSQGTTLGSLPIDRVSACCVTEL